MLEATAAASATAAAKMMQKSGCKPQLGNIADVKNLMKAKTFENNEDAYDEWRRKTLNYLGAATGLKKTLKDILEVSSESKVTIDRDAIQAQFAEVEEEDIEQADELVFAILDNCTEGESSKIANGAGDGNGFEAWRRM